MCTLTYLLHDNGYELMFNRDEQKSRALARLPQFYELEQAIYPVDPQGGGTWLAVNSKGMTLALLNNYQAPSKNHPSMKSRGQLLTSLLNVNSDISQYLATMNLSIYNPFQLCIFSAHLSLKSPQVLWFKWDGITLERCDVVLPITSSGVDFPEVSACRKKVFNDMVNVEEPLIEQLKTFHYSKQSTGKLSVNMERDDAQTVSISHVSVSDNIKFNYFDNVTDQHSVTEMARVSR